MSSLKNIIIDEHICHGQATFRGTRVMVWQVLEQVAAGMDWDDITKGWNGSVTREAIAEAVSAASSIIAKHPEIIESSLLVA